MSARDGRVINFVQPDTRLDAHQVAQLLKLRPRRSARHHVPDLQDVARLHDMLLARVHHAAHDDARVDGSRLGSRMSGMPAAAGLRISMLIRSIGRCCLAAIALAHRAASAGTFTRKIMRSSPIANRTPMMPNGYATA